MRTCEGKYNKKLMDVLVDDQLYQEININCDSRYRSIIDRLDDMITQVSAEPEVNLSLGLNQLLFETVIHTSSENRCMEVVGFSKIKEHRANHQFICENTVELLDRFSKGNNVLPIELSYLKRLWVVHLQLYDKTLEDYLST